MGFVESLRVSAEGVEAGLGAEIDRPAAVLQARKVRRVCITELPPAESHKAWVFLRLAFICVHLRLRRFPPAGPQMD